MFWLKTEIIFGHFVLKLKLLVFNNNGQCDCFVRQSTRGGLLVRQQLSWRFRLQFNQYSNLYFLCLQHKSINLMEDYDQQLQLYRHYPLFYFQPYRKITKMDEYKQALYHNLALTLNTFCDIFVQYLLLLLQSAQLSSTISMAKHPGQLNGRYVHFYTADTSSRRGFVKIELKQIRQQISCFIDSLRTATIIDLQAHTSKEQFVKSIDAFNYYLQQTINKQSNASFNCKHNTSQIIINLISSKSTQAIMKHSTLFKIKTGFFSTKIMNNCLLSSKKQQQNENDHSSQRKGAWRHKIEHFCSFLLDCERENIIYNLKQTRKMADCQDEDSTQTQNQVAIIRLCFKFTCFLDVQIQFKCSQPNYFHITTRPQWQVDKKNFVLLETLWMKIQVQWMQATIGHNVKTDLISIQNLKMVLGSQKEIEIKQRIKFSSCFEIKQKAVCSLDKQILFQIILAPLLEAIQNKISRNTWQNGDIIWIFQQKSEYILLLSKKWANFLSNQLTKLISL